MALLEERVFFAAAHVPQQPKHQFVCGHAHSTYLCPYPLANLSCPIYIFTQFSKVKLKDDAEFVLVDGTKAFGLLSGSSGSTGSKGLAQYFEVLCNENYIGVYDSGLPDYVIVEIRGIYNFCNSVVQFFSLNFIW